MEFTGLPSEIKQNSQAIILESPTSRSDSTMHQSVTIFCDEQNFNFIYLY